MDKASGSLHGAAGGLWCFISQASLMPALRREDHRKGIPRTRATGTMGFHPEPPSQVRVLLPVRSPPWVNRHKLLNLILAFLVGESQQFLDNLEHSYDVPFGRLTELSHQQNCRHQQTFGGIIEVCVLPEGSSIHAEEDNGFGNDLGILLCLCLVNQLVRMLLVQMMELPSPILRLPCIPINFDSSLPTRIVSSSL